jgi:uncharacterized protein YktB (UPF0637 family)
VRTKVVRYVRNNAYYFTRMLPLGLTLKKYCDKMSKEGVDGGEIELEAISQAFTRQIEIYNSEFKLIKTLHNDKVNLVLEPVRLIKSCEKHFDSLVTHDFNASQL